MLHRLAANFYAFVRGLRLLYARRSVLQKWGYMESLKRRRPVWADGSPLPWMNYSVIQFLRERLTPDMTLFEYGCGNSTLFFAERVKEVVSIECDPKWHGEISKNLPSNARLILHHPFDAAAYVAATKQQGQLFDVVVIDDRERAGCLDAALDAVTTRGVIILDDSDGAEWDAHINQWLRRGDFRKLEFVGLKPNGVKPYRTTIFYRDGNVFGI